MVSNQHGTALAYRHNGLLLVGPPGCGKSSLALQLIQQGFALVADDQVLLRPGKDGWTACAPEILHGKLHIRGLGLMDVDYRPYVTVSCVFQSALPAFPLSSPPALDVAVFQMDFFRPDAAAFITETLANI